MGMIKSRWLTAVALISTLMLVTACFQTVRDEAQGQQVSILISPTNTAQPTNTPEPPTEMPTERPTAADVPISSNPTATETPTALAVAQADDESGLLQPAETQDTFELTATQLVIEATGTAVAPLTQTAAAAIGFTATPLPTLPSDAGGTIGTLQPTVPVISGADCIHEVRAGENLFRLSMYYGIPVATIVSRNGIVNQNIISVGQRLIISGCGTTGALPPPTSIPTATSTPFQLGTGGPGLGNPNPGAGGGVTGGVGCVAQYTVNQYDTLFQVSLTYGVSVQSIANANGIININRIDMGQVLCIPAQ